MIELPGASEALCALAELGVRRGYAKGRILIEEGDVGDAIYIILSGRLRAFSRGGNGREITYGSYGPGEYVGEMSLDGGPRSANVEVIETAECAMVARPTLEQFIAGRPEFAFELLGKVIGRARAATLSARQMALNDVYGRLRLLLASQAEQDADGTRVIRRRLTHQSLADRLGCSRPMISRVLKDLERGGHLLPAGRGWAIPGELPLRW